jgi:hypothetical protein
MLEKYNEQKSLLDRREAVVKARIYSRMVMLVRKATTSENAVVHIVAMTACVYICARHFWNAVDLCYELQRRARIIQV